LVEKGLWPSGEIQKRMWFGSGNGMKRRRWLVENCLFEGTGPVNYEEHMLAVIVVAAALPDIG
jgi:hypothetical protein